MKNSLTPPQRYRNTFLDWYDASTFGQVLQSLEASYLQSALNLTYNHRTLQVGLTGSETLYIDPDFLPGFAVLEEPPLTPSARVASVAAALNEWPVASESIDTLILPHIIEFELNRHQILREAERILKPEGRLFILCLNPLSLHGIIQYLPRTSSYWRANFVTSRRLLDWLSLLKFDSEYSAAFAITTNHAITRPSTFWARARAEVSFAYAIKAIKRRYNVVPLDPAWVAVPSLATGSMFEQTRLDPNACQKKS